MTLKNILHAIIVGIFASSIVGAVELENFSVEGVRNSMSVATPIMIDSECWPDCDAPSPQDSVQIPV